MRGNENNQSGMFHYFSVEERVPANHPLRAIQALTEQALKKLNATLEAMYSDMGRPSIPPERILKAQLLMALYTVRSERLFCEMLEYNILFRWFLGMSMEEAVFDHSTFSRNRLRLIESEIGQEFLAAVVSLAREKELLSDEHFTVDGTLIESWASLKSFRNKNDQDGTPGGKNPDVNFHKEKRSNETHQSTTDPESRLARKGLGKEAKLCFNGNTLMDNRHGLIVDAELLIATGTSEVEAAAAMLERQIEDGRNIKTVGADKLFHQTGFVEKLRDLDILPHIALKKDIRIPGLDRRTTRHGSYLASQRKRKLIEEGFGFIKTTGNLRKSRFFGRIKNEFVFLLTNIAYDIIRIAKLAPATG